MLDMLKIIHTSDWHLGRTLAGKRRDEEFAAFLSWLLERVVAEQADGLLIAGDVFDKTAPTHRAQELYYDFLAKIVRTSCQWVVIIAGNHDSPYFLEASQQLLQSLKIYVVGQISSELDDEILILKDKDNTPQLIVCAVPYLRDRDVRLVSPGESIDDKGRKLKAGITEHYAQIAARAERIRSELEADIPIIAMGHLFTQGGRTADGDGVRELYVGTLAHLASDIFPSTFAYTALGHLHIAQAVGASKRVYYCGSPIPMGFGEAEQTKQIALIQLSSQHFSHETITIPVFQQLKQIRGDWQHITAQISKLARTGASVWLEVIYEGDDLIADLRQQLENAVVGTALELIIIKNKPPVIATTTPTADQHSLDEFSPEEIFEKLLIAQQIPETQRIQLRQTYQLLLTSMHEDGAHEPTALGVASQAVESEEKSAITTSLEASTP